MGKQAAFKQKNLEIPFVQKTHTTAQLIVDGKPFIMLAGEVHNSSSSSLDYMDNTVWDKLVALNCNTAIVPVFWELVEPVEGKFDFSLLDGLVNGARKRGLHLVILWFGSWKNSASDYVPQWVKTNIKRFPRVHNKSGEIYPILSCLSAESCKADSHAFAACMDHLRKIDEAERTVVMVQVENEVGLLGTSRDFSALGEVHFNQDVPAQLLTYLSKNAGSLSAEMTAILHKNGNKTKGTWQNIFGAEADEVFTAWHTACYVNSVAEAGHKQYPLPLYVNAWLVQYNGELPGQYPSGGPVSRMFDVWRCAAPLFFCYAPDIYLEDFAGVCAQYAQPNNPLLIPEARRDETAAANVFYAIGEYDALGFSVFGPESMVDGKIPTLTGVVPDNLAGMISNDQGARLSRSYLLLNKMMPIITLYPGTDRKRGILQGNLSTQIVILGNYRIRITFPAAGQPGKTPAGGVIIAVTDDEFIIAGHGFKFEFLAPQGLDCTVEYLFHEEGTFLNGAWVPQRRLNGDEKFNPLGEEPEVRRVKFFSLPHTTHTGSKKV